MISFFELWVSYKFLFPKTKEKFFSIITFISFAGISLGVATLIIVMSVMNGFRDELTSKILGVNGHLKVKPFNNFKIEKHFFTDHHNFEEKDFKLNNSYPIFVSEKDAVKCSAFAREDWWFLPVNASLPNDFDQKMLVKLASIGHANKK